MRELLERLVKIPAKIDDKVIESLRRAWEDQTAKSKVPHNSWKASIKFLEGIRRWLAELYDDLAFTKGLHINRDDASSERAKAMHDVVVGVENLRGAILWMVEDLTAMAKVSDKTRVTYKRSEAVDDPDQEAYELTMGRLSDWNRAFKRVLKRLRDVAYFNQPKDLTYTLGRAKIIVRDIQPSADRDRTGHRPVGGPHRRVFLSEFDRARKMLKSKGLEYLWYGPMFVERPRSTVAATYHRHKDVLTVHADPDIETAEFIVHELGHRLWYKFMSSGDRARFAAHFGKVSAVSSYGGTKPEEDFAEMFRWYVLGRKLSRDQLERFKSFTRVKGRKIRDDVIDRLELLCVG